jgi:hypothetical protein
MLVANELGDAGEDLAIAPKVSGPGQRQMERGAGARGVADVVDE